MLNPVYGTHKSSSDVSPEDVQVIRHPAFIRLFNEVNQSLGFMAKQREDEEKKALAICRSFEKQGYAGGIYYFAVEL